MHKRNKTCCYWKIINSGVVTVPPELLEAGFRLPRRSKVEDDRQKARQTHVDDFVEVGVLTRRVLVLAQHVLNGLCGQQVAHFLLLEV